MEKTCWGRILPCGMAFFITATREAASSNASKGSQPSLGSFPSGCSKQRESCFRKNSNTPTPMIFAPYSAAAGSDGFQESEPLPGQYL